MMKFITRYFWNLLIAVDQLANTVFWGDPDETISSRMGRFIKQDNCHICKIVCWFLDFVDPDHCKNSIEEDEGSRGLGVPPDVVFIFWGVVIGATIVFTIFG